MKYSPCTLNYNKNSWPKMIVGHKEMRTQIWKACIQKMKANHN